MVKITICPSEPHHTVNMCKYYENSLHNMCVCVLICRVGNSKWAMSVWHVTSPELVFMPDNINIVVEVKAYGPPHV